MAIKVLRPDAASALGPERKERLLLGEHHRAGALKVEPAAGHFDLEDAERICVHLDDLVNQLRHAGVS